MFAKVLLIAALALIAWAALARASHGAGPEQRYTVKPGDTLWSIAVDRYGGDPRSAVWKIERRNGLAGRPLIAGARLVLP
jgi:LysM repeat protein